VVHARTDPSVPAANAEYIYARLGSAQKELCWLNRGGHVATEGPARQQLNDRVLAFVAAHAPRPAASG
jgi:esterase/lipase